MMDRTLPPRGEAIPAIAAESQQTTSRIWPLALVAVLFVGCLFALPPMIKAFRADPLQTNKDYSLWYRVGLSIRADEPLYRYVDSYEIWYMYPPTMAVMILAPLSHLGYPGFVACFALGNIACWIACVLALPRLVSQAGEATRVWVYALPWLATGAYVWDMFHLGQCNLILLTLMLASWAALRRGWPSLAGSALGFAIAIKVFPLPALVYFVVRRQWRGVAAAAITCLVCVLVLPGLVRGMDRNFQEVQTWAGIMLGDQSGQTMAARSGIGFSWRNASVVSVAHRLLRPVPAGDVRNVPYYVNVAALPPRVVQGIGYAMVLSLGCLLLWATRCRFAPTARAEAMEWAMVLTLVVLSSPLSWTYFFCWLMPGWAVLAHAVTRPGQSPRVRLWAILGMILAGVLLGSAAFQTVDPMTSAYGVTTWGAMILFGTLAYVRRMEPVEQTPDHSLPLILQKRISVSGRIRPVVHVPRTTGVASSPEGHHESSLLRSTGPS